MPTMRTMAALALALALAVVVGLPERARSTSVLPAGEVTTRFRPSVYGLPFRNPARDPADPLVRQATAEQCGGMAFFALDSYAANARPAVRSSRAPQIQARSASSIVSNGARFVLWSMWPDRARSALEGGVVTLTRTEELPRLRDALGQGPVPIGLVRARGVRSVGMNHQVVAYGIRREGSVVTIRIYDPTQPGADDVVLVTDLSDESGIISERAGEWEIARWRGLFLERYSPVSPTAL